MRQSRRKMINVTCSQTIKKQVDSFLATEYKAWRNMIEEPRSADSIKHYFSCTSDNSNTLLMEYVRHIYKEYGIRDPLVSSLQGSDVQPNREKLSDLIKNQRQSYLLHSESQRQSISISPPIKQQYRQSPIKLIESKYSADNIIHVHSNNAIRLQPSFDYTPIKNNNNNLQKTSHMEASTAHRRRSSDLRVNMTTTGRTQSKLHTQNSQQALLKKSEAATEKKTIKLFLGGVHQRSTQFQNNNMIRSMSKNNHNHSQNIKSSRRFQPVQNYVPNILSGYAEQKNILMRIEDVNQNNGSNNTSYLKVRDDTSPIKQELRSQDTRISDKFKFSRKINSLTLRSDQPVPEIYRYCLACENAVLEQNIQRHQLICPNFAEMYKLDLDGLLNHLQNKIQNIRGKLQGQAQFLQQDDAKNLQNLSRDLSRQSLTIFKSGSMTQRFVKDYNSAISIGRKWGETSETVNKLRWFIKVREQLKQHFGV